MGSAGFRQVNLTKVIILRKIKITYKSEVFSYCVVEDRRPNHSISKEQLKTKERVSPLKLGPRVALVKLVFSSTIKVKVGLCSPILTVKLSLPVPKVTIKSPRESSSSWSGLETVVILS